MESYFLFPEGGESSELGFTPSQEVLNRYPIDLSTGLATLQPPQEQGPVINDLERIAYAAPPNVRFDIPPNLNAGLATLPQMVPVAPAPNPPTRFPMSAPAAVTKFTPEQPKLTAASIGTTLDPTTEDRYNVVGVDKEDKETISTAPVTGTGGGSPDITVKQLTPKDIEEMMLGQTPTTSTPTITPGTNTPPPGTAIEEAPSEYVPARVILEPRTYDPIQITDFQFSEPAPTAPITRQPGRLIPTLKPIDIELPMRRAIERLAPGIFKDINYDPELILEAAMRSLGPRYAKQSLLDEQRMFERMK
jgi:hypothetical protein